MTKLNDLQAILLSTASQRDDGALHPVPTNIAAAGDRLVKALKSMADRGLIVKLAEDEDGVARRNELNPGPGYFITDVGRVAIGVNEPATALQPAGAEVPTQTCQTKAALVLDLLQRPTGATATELTEATGWLPHTTRAALTGLRKRGHTILREKRGDATCYRIAAA